MAIYNLSFKLNMAGTSIGEQEFFYSAKKQADIETAKNYWATNLANNYTQGLNSHSVYGVERPAEGVPKSLEGETKTEDNIWDMTKGGKSINGRWYSEHSLERMAPDTPQVRAELEARAIQKGLQPGTIDFNNYVNPRGVPPIIVEDAIQNGTRAAGNTIGTWVYESGNVRVVTNNNGGVVTVIPK